jgi:hypothetical protein
LRRLADVAILDTIEAVGGTRRTTFISVRVSSLAILFLRRIVEELKRKEKVDGRKKRE